ncbi:DUF916 domain-containing protein [Arthrobacter sp. NPDC080073]|uniref:WxL protein peptidoglycan domain-containing protein n=1 Tax=Arthrobacter sp. NPDC080073 TaxID=3155919 RepID=UPI00342AF644
MTGPRNGVSRLLLTIVLLVSGSAVGAAVGPLNDAAAADSQQPVNLSLKPLDQAGSYFSLTMDPGQSRQLKVELGNHGAVAIAARTYAADAYSLINGGFGAKDRDSTSTGTTTWLSYTPQVLQLPAGQGSTRTFALTVPDGTAPGDYITSLVLENDVPLQGSGSVVLNQIVRQAIAVSVHVPGPLQAALALGAASHTTTADRSVVDVQVKNTGTTNLKPAGQLVIRDHKGNTVSQAAVTMDSVYARTDTQVETTLDGKLQPGDYTASLTLKDAATEAAVDATVPFTVKDLAPATSAGEQQGQLPKIIQDASAGPVPYLLVAGLLAALAGVATLIQGRRKSRRRQNGPSA